MFKRLRQWLLQPLLEDLAFIRHDIQKAKLLRWGRITELENIVDNLTYDNTVLRAQINVYRVQFGKNINEELEQFISEKELDQRIQFGEAMDRATSQEEHDRSSS